MHGRLNTSCCSLPCGLQITGIQRRVQQCRLPECALSSFTQHIYSASFFPVVFYSLSWSGVIGSRVYRPLGAPYPVAGDLLPPPPPLPPPPGEPLAAPPFFPPPEISLIIFCSKGGTIFVEPILLTLHRQGFRGLNATFPSLSSLVFLLLQYN